MRHIFKSPAAKSDLENIWLYSFGEWGEEQADRYYDELIAGMEHLTAHPELGRSREAIRHGYYSIQINHHVIYYRLQSDMIDIVRVLHERMNPKQHL